MTIDAEKSDCLEDEIGELDQDQDKLTPLLRLKAWTRNTARGFGPKTPPRGAVSSCRTEWRAARYDKRMTSDGNGLC